MTSIVNEWNNFRFFTGVDDDLVLSHYCMNKLYYNDDIKTDRNDACPLSLLAFTNNSLDIMTETIVHIYSLDTHTQP